jgi:hypothetical protein
MSPFLADSFIGYKMKLFLPISAGSLILIINSIPSTTVKAENLLKNADFEQSESVHSAKFWEYPKVASFGKYRLSQDQASSGKNSIKIVGDGSNKNYGFFQKLSGIKSGAKFKITTKLFVKDFQQGRIKVIHTPIIYQKDGVREKEYPGVWLIPENCNKGQWVTYTFILDLSEHQDTKFLYVWGLGWKHKGKPFIGEVYWDDFSIVELPEVHANNHEKQLNPQ